MEALMLSVLWRVAGMAIASVSVSVTALAFDFGTADALFAQREQGPAKIAQARAAYATGLINLNGAEKIYAVEQLARLDYYEGLLLGDQGNKDDRKAIYQRCIDTLDTHIAPAKLGPTPQFYYWKASCLALWGNANGVSASLGRIPELLRLINDGLTTDTRYEGGGLYRLASAVYLKIPEIFGGGVDKSFDFNNRALASAAFPGSQDPSTSTGNYFFNVYDQRAQALAKKGRKAEAISLLAEALERIDAGDVPVGREPETRLHRRDIEATLSSLQQL
jgi:tetratricopeptide (TPR) repeat protein